MIPIARPLIGEEEQRAVASVMASGHLAAGDVVRHFETEFADFVEAQHAVAVANGTVALQLAFEALGIGAGDEVVVPAFTFVATANAVLAAGAIPRLVDVDEETFTMRADRLEKAINGKTKAIVPVHLYGQAADMEAIAKIADDHDLALIGDAAQAHGARIGNKPVGGFGTCETFSFYPTKNMTCGEGGMVTTDDGELAARMRSIANHGRAEARLGVYDHLRRGHNWRMSNIHAAIGREQLKKLDGFNDRRREIARKYDVAFGALQGVRTPTTMLGNYHVYHQYTLRCADRGAIVQALETAGVGSGVYYPKAIHQYPHLEAYASTRVVAAQRLANEVLSIPVHPGLSDQDVATVIGAVTAGATKTETPARA